MAKTREIIAATARQPKQYAIEIADSAARAISKLDKPVARRIIAAIEKLKIDARPSGVKALQGEPAGTMRLRVGDYRVVYVVHDARVTVVIVRVGHRREVYR